MAIAVTWGYDNAYRLTSEERKLGAVVQYRDTFTYDAVGNRTVLENAAGLTTYTYDAANQLETAVLGAARTTYTYDNNGNLEVEDASGTRTTHTWNDENQLIQVAKTGMTTNQYTFNGDGQRVQIVDSQGTKKPIWDFENILLETDGSDVTQVVYTLEPNVFGNLVSQRRGSTTSVYLFDALGSTRKLTDSSGNVTDSYDFRAYGETYASSGSTVNVFRWVGELGYYLDLDRLAYYLRARSYNPAIAKFLSRDPLGFKGSKWNLYGYVRSNPIKLTDPSGEAAPVVVVVCAPTVTAEAVACTIIVVEAIDTIVDVICDRIWKNCEQWDCDVNQARTGCISRSCPTPSCQCAISRVNVYTGEVLECECFDPFAM